MIVLSKFTKELLAADKYKKADPWGWHKMFRNLPKEYPNLIRKKRKKMPVGRLRKLDHLSSLIDDAATTSADLVDHTERLEAFATELRAMAKRLDEIGV